MDGRGSISVECFRLAVFENGYSDRHHWRYLCDLELHWLEQCMGIGLTTLAILLCHCRLRIVSIVTS